MHDRSYPPCCALHQAREIIKADPTCPVIIQLNNLVDFFGAQMTKSASNIVPRAVNVMNPSSPLKMRKLSSVLSTSSISIFEP